VLETYVKEIQSIKDCSACIMYLSIPESWIKDSRQGQRGAKVLVESVMVFIHDKADEASCDGIHS